MKSILVAVAAALSLTVAAPAFAEYPEKPVNFIVPWPPGDLEDVLTRMIAEDFQKEYGVAAAVVNKPGGGGGPFPGAIEVAQAPADGYTIGSFVIGVPVVGHKIDIAELAPEKFDPLGIFLTYPFVLAASGDAPYNTIQEMAEHGKTNELALGHFGAPLIPTRVSLAYAKTAGFEWGSDAGFDMLDCNTLASGDADVINTHAAAGTRRALTRLNPGIGDRRTHQPDTKRTNNGRSECRPRSGALEWPVCAQGNTAGRA